MSEMTEGESSERFNENMKKAVSRARELALVSGNTDWMAVADNLEMLRSTGMKLHHAKSLSRAEALRMLDEHNDKAAGTQAVH